MTPIFLVPRLATKDVKPKAAPKSAPKAAAAKAPAVPAVKAKAKADPKTSAKKRECEDGATPKSGKRAK